MEAGMKTDLLNTMREILMENTSSYRSDFEYDMEKLTTAAREPKVEDRTFYWLSRPCGTWCLNERNVFLEGTVENTIWTHYENEHHGFRAFRVVVEEMQGACLYGSLIPFDYGESVRRIKRASLPAVRVSGQYADGEPFTMSQHEFRKTARCEAVQQHGGIQNVRYYPESEEELKLRITKEHREQKRKPERKTEKRRDRPER